MTEPETFLPKSVPYIYIPSGEKLYMNEEQLAAVMATYTDIIQVSL